MKEFLTIVGLAFVLFCGTVLVEYVRAEREAKCEASGRVWLDEKQACVPKARVST